MQLFSSFRHWQIVFQIYTPADKVWELYLFYIVANTIPGFISVLDVLMGVKLPYCDFNVYFLIEFCFICVYVTWTFSFVKCLFTLKKYIFYISLAIFSLLIYRNSLHILSGFLLDTCTCCVQWHTHSRVRRFVTSSTVACQDPLSIGILRQEYWTGLPFSLPGDLPNPGIKTDLLHYRQILYHLSHYREAQEYWSGLPISSPGELPDLGIELGSLAFQVVHTHIHIQTVKMLNSLLTF